MSRIIWGGCAILLFLVFVVPSVDFSRQDDTPRVLGTPDPFADFVIDAEELLHNGRLAELDQDDAYRIAPLLKARALTKAGPIAPHEMEIVVEFIDEYRPQIAGQSGEGSRRALRNHRDELMLKELPRLDPEKAQAAMKEIRLAYDEAFDIDPSAARR